MRSKESLEIMVLFLIKKVKLYFCILLLKFLKKVLHRMKYYENVIQM